VAELALDDVERHAFARHLDRVGMSELMRGEARPHTSTPSLVLCKGRRSRDNHRRRFSYHLAKGWAVRLQVATTWEGVVGAGHHVPYVDVA
jgi:hypothetical protein